MLVRCVSDLHTELMNRKQLDRFLTIFKALTKSNLLILAGDIGNPKSSFLKEFLQACHHIADTIIYVAGNHEHYKHSLESCQTHLQRVCKECNIVYLDKEIFEYHGYVILGCTLWSQLTDRSYFIKDNMNDFHKIVDLNITRYKQMHKDCVEWLTTKLAEYKSRRKIVITHHLPSCKLLDKQYTRASSPYYEYNMFYASNLDSLVGQADYWFHGHSHQYLQTKIADCICYRNPLGYQHESTHFKDELLALPRILIDDLDQLEIK